MITVSSAIEWTSQIIPSWSYNLLLVPKHVPHREHTNNVHHDNEVFLTQSLTHSCQSVRDI